MKDKVVPLSYSLISTLPQSLELKILLLPLNSIGLNGAARFESTRPDARREEGVF